MATKRTLPQTDSPELHIVEVVGRDGLVHHLGPFKSRAAAERWIAQNAPPQCCCDHEQTVQNDAPSRRRRPGVSAL